MKITVIGFGYAGLVSGACLAKLDNNVAYMNAADAKDELANLAECVEACIVPADIKGLDIEYHGIGQEA